MYTFTNHFSRSALGSRIQMMQRTTLRRGREWSRYGLMAAVTVLLALACARETPDDDGATTLGWPPKAAYPINNPTRRLARRLDQAKFWFQQAGLVADTNDSIAYGYPKMLYLRSGQLGVLAAYAVKTRIFLNGRAVSAEELARVPFAQVQDLFAYERWEGMPGSDTIPALYQVLVETTNQPTRSPRWADWRDYLTAAAVSDYPLGESHTYRQNDLLQALAFEDPNTFVSATKTNYLRLREHVTGNVAVYIDGQAVGPEALGTIHVRQVDRLYTRERPYMEWLSRPVSHRLPRYVVFVQTAPKRAQRDNNYYVFSPFYSGDF